MADQAAPRRPSEGPRERRIEQIVLASSVRVLGLTLGVFVLALLAWRLRALILLILLSGFVAALLMPFVRLFRTRGLSRTNAVLLVYILLIAVAAGFGFLIVHPIYTSATHFARVLPHLVEQAQQGKGRVGEIIRRLHLASYISAHAPALETAITKLGKPALAVGKTVVGGVVSLITIAFLSFFLLLEAPRAMGGVLGFFSDETALLCRRIAEVTARQVSGFMAGDLATSVVAGLVVFVTLRLTNVPFATVLALWVGLVDFLPLVGGLLAGVPTVGIAFLHSVFAGIVTVIVFLVYQQIENHVLYPLIVSKTVRLSPLFVLLAVLIGAETGSIIGSTFGAICGAIVAVPLAGSLEISLRELLEVRRARRARPVPHEVTS